MTVRIGYLAVVEGCLLGTGLVFLTAYTGASLYRSVAPQLALREFESAQAALASSDGSPVAVPGADGRIDFSLWSGKRSRAYREGMTVRKGATLAVLRITRLNLRVL